MVFVLGSAVVSAQDSADPAEQQRLALEAQRILKERCANCHNGQKREGGRLSVEDYGVLTETVTGETYETFVKPGSLKDSGIWDQVAVLKEMPRNGKSLSDDELSTLRTWIEKGAPSWETSRKIEFITEQQQLKSIRDYLTDAEPRKIPQLRFFTLANIYNDPSYSERDLNLHRAALSKAVNAMSRAGAIILPAAIDAQKTIYAVNISELGWQDDWSEVIKKYPYGLKPINSKANPEVRRIYDAIEKLYTSVGVGFGGAAGIRVDWFVTRATRPDLYHR
ncbi:MAG: c-type cytochrome, partial [Planctomycetota bacterium]